MRGRTNAVGGESIRYVDAQISVEPDMGRYLFAFDTDEGPQQEKFGLDGASAHDPIIYKVPLGSSAFNVCWGPSNVAPISTSGLELIYRYDISDASLVAVYEVTGDFTITRLYGTE